MKRIIVSISLAILLCACGPSQGSGAPVTADTSTPVTVNPVSKNGNIIAGAALLGALVGTGVVPYKSAPIEFGNESIQLALAKFIFDDVFRKSATETGQAWVSRSKDATSSEHKEVKYEKEAFSTYGGYVTLTGTVDYDINKSSKYIVIDGYFAANFMDITLPVVYGGEEKNETINGSTSIRMNIEIVNYSADDLGNVTHAYATLDFDYDSDRLRISGDVAGDAYVDMQYEATVDLISGEALKTPQCNGSVIVVADKLKETCEMWSTCGGCSGSSKVENL